MVLENHEVIVLSQEDHSSPLDSKHGWMLDFKNIKRLPGPRFPDGSINWQCPCMAGGSLVAHRCGHHFRELYVCMSANENDDLTVKCPDQFINWSACMQSLSEGRKTQMKQALKNDNKELSIERK